MTPSLENQTIVVTGGGGFIGSHLVDSLADDNEVRVVDRFSTDRRRRLPSSVAVIEGDIRTAAIRESALRGADIVFHEAAIVDIERSIADPDESHAVNVDATLSLLEATRRTGARLVFASSAAIYGSPTTVPITENEPKTPSSPYGLEKLSADHYCRLYHDLYDVDAVALRYFNVYGPGHSGGGTSGVITKFIHQARAGGPITIQGDGEQTRDFVHVSDVVRANLLAATTDHIGTAFNVGTGDSITIRTLAEHIRDAVDPDVRIVHTDPRPGDVRASLADISEARARLGYEPTVDVRAGIESVVDSEPESIPSE